MEETRLFCPKCGTPSPADAVYCAKCGTKLPLLSEILRETQMADLAKEPELVTPSQTTERVPISFGGPPSVFLKKKVPAESEVDEKFLNGYSFGPGCGIYLWSRALWLFAIANGLFALLTRGCEKASVNYANAGDDQSAGSALVFAFLFFIAWIAYAIWLGTITRMRRWNLLKWKSPAHFKSDEGAWNVVGAIGWILTAIAVVLSVIALTSYFAAMPHQTSASTDYSASDYYSYSNPEPAWDYPDVQPAADSPEDQVEPLDTEQPAAEPVAAETVHSGGLATKETALPASTLKQLYVDVEAQYSLTKATVRNESTWTVTSCTLAVSLAPKSNGIWVTKYVELTSYDLPILPYGSSFILLEDVTDWKFTDFQSHDVKVTVSKAGGYPPEEDSITPPKAEETEEEAVGDASEYIFIDSNSRLLTEANLAGLDQRTLTLARNEIYARHGYTFNIDWIAEYFETKSWYRARNNQDPDFSDFETRNIEFLLSKEWEAGSMTPAEKKKVYF